MKLKGVFFLFLALAALLTVTESHPAYEASPEDTHGNFDIVFPERLNIKGRAKRDLFTKSKKGHDDRASFKLKAFGKQVAVDVRLNKLVLTPQFTLRYFKEDGQLVEQKVAPTNCHYQGYVIGQAMGSTVILDTCHGLSGMIEDDEGQMYIEPYPTKGKGAHKIYKTNNYEKEKGFSCGMMSPEEMPAEEASGTQASSSRNKREAEETIYKKYLTTKKTRYVELMIIVDNVVYKKYKRSIADVKRRVFTLVNAVDAIYRKINIRVVLSALEIWTDKDHVPFVKQAGEDLRNFENHRSSNLAGIRYDSIHLLRGKMWDDFGGMAYRGEICTRRSLGVDAWNYWGSLGPWLALSHELGHNLNFDHDNIWPSCKCLSPRGCVMGSFKTRVPGFSDCNLQNMSSIDDSCLHNLPKKVVNPRCGNGIPEPGEECDCGTPEDCNVRDPCCEPNDCRLKKSSQCSDSMSTCCQKCQFSPGGTLCRKSSGECDVEEVCSGRSAECPSDDHIKDGRTCEGDGELLLGKYVGNVKMTKLSRPITARHLRISPQYWERGLCTKIDLLGCGIGSSVSPVASTSIQGYDNLCVTSQGGSPCSTTNGAHLVYSMQTSCRNTSAKFTFLNGVLKQHCSGKKICPKGVYYGAPLVISDSCEESQAKFERTKGKSLRHVASGLCVHPEGGVAYDGVRLVLWAGCDQDRLTLNFLAHDCLASLNVADRSVIPDSRISASSHLQGYPAKEARLHSLKGWCAARKDKKQFIQVDLGQAKKISAVILSGTDHGEVRGYSLHYSLDGQQWTVWSSKPRVAAFCYRGKCVPSADTQCRDLWGPEASSAHTACYRHFNVKAQGFGTCSSRTNLPCTNEHAKCGQLQCSSTKERPVVDYGSFYELKTLTTGEKCRAASLKRGSGNELVGMVKDGTVCANQKICVANQCTSLDQLSSKRCPRIAGKECAGKGVCTSSGKCHCQGNFDPDTFCRTAKQARSGEWGQWSEWTNCTRICGGGTRKRHRFCNNPAPSNGGQNCVGNRLEKEACNGDKCPEVHSCQHLFSLGKQTGVQFPDGVYTINPDGKGTVDTYCDMSRDGGGWTLLVTSHTNTWTASDVRKRNHNRPTLNGDFSILYKADDIKDSVNVKGNWFEYRIEANERGRWGGIWRAPRDYTFLARNNKQTNVDLAKKFDRWKYDDYGIERRMPWISGAKLTTSRNATGDRQWGTLIANSRIFNPAPWLDGNDLEQHPVNIWYWVREQFSLPRSCMDIQLRGVHPPKDGIHIIFPRNRRLQTFCKFSEHGGAWTLVLTSASDSGWTRENVKFRNTERPSLTSDYSILGVVDKITKMEHFQYRIKEESRKPWEGVWTAKTGCSFISSRLGQSCVENVHQQGNWNTSKQAKSSKRIPHLTNLGKVILTIAVDDADLNGAIVVDSTEGVNRTRAKVITVWLREGTWRSCNEIKMKRGGIKAQLEDGIYMIRKNAHEYLPVYCDMTSESGGYTLLVTSASSGWSKNEVKFKNTTRPSITRDYSILGYADQIKALSGGNTFKYRLEANTRGHWGGVWTAPIKYSFVNENNQQTNVTLVKKFNDWRYDWRDSLEKRMPWLGARQSLLTTSTHSDYSDWGSIISEKKSSNPAPWIYGSMPSPGVIWYWINEDDCDASRNPVNGGLSEWTTWTGCSQMCVQGHQTRRRLCNNPPPRCGGHPCGGMVAKEERQCFVCPKSPILAHGDLCLQPENGECNPIDNTRLVYIRDTPQCSKNYMVFTYHDDVLTHQCSGKKVCPQGTGTWQTPLVISSACQIEESKFQWTSYKTLKHKSSGFCVHPLSGTPKSGTSAILWQDDCNEDRLQLDLFKLPVFQSPIQAFNGFCLQPASSNCDPADNTRLVYHKAARCKNNYMFFTYKNEVLIHTCSGKRVCPQDATPTWETPLVISSRCSTDASKFQRTFHKTLIHTVSGFCVHPYGGPPKEGIHAILWKDNCNEKRLQLDLSMLRGPG